MNKKQISLLLLLTLVLSSFFLFDLGVFFNLSYFQQQREILLEYKNSHFLLSSAAYFCLYTLITAFSLPTAAIVTVIGGAIFGLWWGLLLVSFASSIGASAAFLMARTLLRDWVQDTYGQRLGTLNEGIEKDGIFYLFTLRLIPVFPFFLVNVLMALTPIRLRDFYWVSQLGMLFGTALYVEVGVQLGLAESLPAIFSVGMIRVLLLLAVFPWISRALLRLLRQQKLYREFSKPQSFDANLIIIGAGSAGLVSAYIAVLSKAKVILIEKDRMGGDCLNTGCVPSKALIRRAGVKNLIDRAEEFGIDSQPAKVDFPALMRGIKDSIEKIAPHDSVERYSKLGVECVQADAKILSPYRVQVGDQEITGRQIVIASGASPLIPDIPGLQEISYVTSDSIWNLNELPKRFLVLGAGPIGCELAQAFARLGSQVCIADKQALPLSKEDEDVSLAVLQCLEKDGICFLGQHELLRFKREAEVCRAIFRYEQQERLLDFDVVLIALGRKANTENLGLEVLGLEKNQNGTIKVNEYLQTSYPNIYACGDVAGPYQFTHMAAHQAWYASINSLFSGFRQFKIDYSIVPWATFTDPEVARVGLNEKEAKQRGIEFDLTTFAIDDLDRAIVDRENIGFVKVLTQKNKDTILGVCIVGYHASELIAEFILAMKHGLGIKAILNTIHIYPTLSESNKYVASQWRKTHAPQWVFPILERFHQWRRK
jgi:pyruvate/2-oxoglutarate dehydrogenase complex dihydrolipoamide dehydrogenase (E3) component/uncharacterized membrane protein YdjX (TVP38/TMEM64 family)